MCKTPKKDFRSSPFFLHISNSNTLRSPKSNNGALSEDNESSVYKEQIDFSDDAPLADMCSSGTINKNW